MNELLKNIEKILKNRRKNKRWKNIVTVLASVVVFITAYSLILPAITLEKESTVIESTQNEDGENTDAQSDDEDSTGQNEESTSEDENDTSEDETQISEDETTGAEDTSDSSDSGITFTYEDDSVSAKITLSEDTNVPEDAKLNITEVADDSDYETAIEEAVDGQPLDVRLFDISFYTLDDEYIEVDDFATVSIMLKDTVIEENKDQYIAVLHFEEEETFTPDITEVILDEESQTTQITFETEGFSTYAVVTVQETEAVGDGDYIYTYTRVDATSSTNYSGTYVIANLNASTTMDSDMGSTDVELSDDNSELYVYSDSSSSSGITEWTLSRNNNGSYSIYYTSGSTKYYLYVNFWGNLSTTTDQWQSTSFTISLLDADEDTISLSYDYFGNTYYLCYSNGSFTVSRNPGTSAYIMSLYEYSGVEENTGGLNIDGKTYAIANINGNRDYAMQSTSETQSGRLDGLAVNVTESSDGTYYLTATDELTLWTFNRQSDGTYYVTTEIDGVTYYLNISGTNLSVSTTAQKITVTVGTGDYEGQVRLSYGSYAVDWYGNNASNGNIFGAYAGSGQNNYQVLAEPVEYGVITYVLNTPSLSGKGTSWANTISTDTVVIADENMTALNAKPSGYTEGLGPAGELYKNNYGVDDEDNPYADLYRMNIVDNYHFTDSSYTTHYLGDDYPYYKEWKFDGWLYTDDEGVEHLFDPETPVTMNNDGTYTGIDTDGNTVIIASDATFTGQWTEVSSPVYFFVNYEGTILDTEGDVSGRNTGAYTPVMAVGTLYFGVETVGNDNVFATDANRKISAMITSSANFVFDEDIPQIIIDHLTIYDGETIYNYEATDANASMLAEAVLALIRGDDSITIMVSTGDGTVLIDNSNATSDNYSVRWYVLKEQTDGWHIDGVLVGSTEEMVISKTFTGLSDDQIAAVLETFEYELKIKYTDSSGETQEGVYMTLNSDLYTGTTLSGTYTGSDGNTYYGIYGQYVYNGYDSDTQTATWTVEVLKNEHYTIEESGYEVPQEQYPTGVEGYVITSDSIIDEDYDTIYYDTKAGYAIYEETGDEKYDVVGGTTSSVIFDNIYTESGKGVLYIVKTSDEINTVLQDVEFTLVRVYDENGDPVSETPVTVTTDSSGRAIFNNLEPGTYELTESNIYPGYNEYDEVITVTVTEMTDGDGNKYTYISAVGSVNGDYGSNETILTLNIVNTLDPETVVVLKTFEGISADEIASLYDSYQIVVYDSEGNEVTLVDRNNEEVDALTFENSARISADGKQVYWNLVRLEPGEYTIVESGYGHENYTIVSVSATYDDDDNSSTSLSVVTDDANSTAYISMEKGDEAGFITITNSYENIFDLYIRKVDSVTGEPLTGAVFKIYGSREEATDTTDTIRYYDDEGNVRTLYYVGTTEATDENGYARISGLSLSDDGQSFAYILDESVVPTGYETPEMTDEDGIIKNEYVITVTVDETNNGMYELQMENTIETYMLTVQKLVPISGSFDENELFGITITITNSDVYLVDGEIQGKRIYSYQVYDENGDEVNGSGMSGTFTDDSGNTETDIAVLYIELKAGWYVQITGVPEDYEYTVYETTDADGDGEEEYYPVMSIAGSGSFDNDSKTAAGIITDPEDTDETEINVVTINNYSEETTDVTTSVTVIKEWQPSMDSGDSATVYLCQKITAADGTVTIRLYAEKESVVLSDDNQWTYTWEDLPLFDEDGNTYNYYVYETPIEDYSAVYSLKTTTINVDGSDVNAALATGGSVTVTNVSGYYTLPSSGGIGTKWYYLGGMTLIAISLLLYKIKIKKIKEKRGNLL